MKKTLCLLLLVSSLAGQADAFSVKGAAKKVGHGLKQAGIYTVVAIVVGAYLYGQSK